MHICILCTSSTLLPWYNIFVIKNDKRIGHLKLYVRKDKEDTANFFANDISRKLKEFRDVEGRDVLFLSSGGSAFSVLDRIQDDVIGPYLTIGLLDERFDPENKITNYAQLRKTLFFKKAVQRGCRLIDTSTKKGQTMEELATYYELEIRRWREQHPKGAIIATIGMGPDGHTAGIMSFPEDINKFHDLFEGEQFIVAYDAHEKSTLRFRVTATITFLRYVDIVGVFIVGKEKGKMLHEVLENKDLFKYPGSIIKTLARGAVYLDKEVSDVVIHESSIK